MLIHKYCKVDKLSQLTDENNLIYRSLKQLVKKEITAKWPGNLQRQGAVFQVKQTFLLDPKCTTTFHVINKLFNHNAIKLTITNNLKPDQ